MCVFVLSNISNEVVAVVRFAAAQITNCLNILIDSTNEIAARKNARNEPKTLKYHVVFIKSDIH